MRKIDKIIIHCLATPEGREVSKTEVRNWHIWPKHYYDKNKVYLYTKYLGKKYTSIESLPKEVRNKRGRGWSDVGYHYIVHLDGKISRGIDEERIGAHCKGQNKNSIGISYVGGMDFYGKEPKDTRTHEQKHAMKMLIETLQDKYPGAEIRLHNEFANKACPSFKKEEL